MKKKIIGQPRVTLAAIAKATGFAISTVSMVLNEVPASRNMPVETRDLIRNAAQEMGYRPDAAARSLRSQRTFMIGVLVFDISDPFCTLILKGIHERLRLTEFLPIIMDAQNNTKQFERYLELMLERRLEGLLIIGNWLVSDAEIVGKLESETLPMYMIGRAPRHSRINSVLVDNRAGGYAALQHLYELGHRSIAIVRGFEGSEDAVERFEGMLEFARDVKWKMNPELIVELAPPVEPFSTFHSASDAVRGWIKGRKTFSAVATFDDLSALGALSALRELGITVPERCSVIGFDDVPYAALAVPALTTIRQPMEQMGTIAADVIVRQIEQGTVGTSSHQRLSPQVVTRGSTAVWRS